MQQALDRYRDALETSSIEVTAEEFSDWKSHPVTTRLMNDLTADGVDILQSMQTISSEIDAARHNAYMGTLEAIENIMNWSPVSESNEDQRD